MGRLLGLPKYVSFNIFWKIEYILYINITFIELF